MGEFHAFEAVMVSVPLAVPETIGHSRTTRGTLAPPGRERGNDGPLCKLSPAPMTVMPVMFKREFGSSTLLRC
jgi:hypothetical protein